MGKSFGGRREKSRGKLGELLGGVKGDGEILGCRSLLLNEEESISSPRRSGLSWSPLHEPWRGKKIQMDLYSHHGQTMFQSATMVKALRGAT